MEFNDNGLVIIEDNLYKSDNVVEDYLQNKDKISSILVIAYKKANNQKKAIGNSWHKFSLMLNLLTDWSKGLYTDVSLRTLMSIITVIIYFISPFDSIFSKLGFNFFDNIKFIKYTIKLINKDLRNYENWKNKQNEYIVI